MLRNIFLYGYLALGAISIVYAAEIILDLFTRI
jgi:hypothetical protein